jgi:hypothetical protein
MTRRRTALVALFAVLLQAFLFAWHMHPAPFSPLGQPVSASAANSASPLSAPATDDDCPICVMLHHLSAAPIDFAALPVPPRPGAAAPLFAATITVRTTTAAFRARAPPYS